MVDYDHGSERDVLYIKVPSPTDFSNQESAIELVSSPNTRENKCLEG